MPQAPLAQGDGLLDAFSVEVSELVDLLLLYRSEYQPPPFKMKPAPPEIWRLAASALQLGQSFSGSAEIRCSASQTCPQAVQM